MVDRNTEKEIWSLGQVTDNFISSKRLIESGTRSGDGDTVKVALEGLGGIVSNRGVQKVYLSIIDKMISEGFSFDEES
jgi:recombination DNA repair RAD52 pathway protein